MKKDIAKNDYYDLSVDIAKNRGYLTIKGFWRNQEVVANYISDWKKALAHLQKGFTLLTDARTMKAHPGEVKTLHNEAQALIIGGGVRQVAEVLENIFAEAQLNMVSKTTTMPKKNFETKEEAEAFLNSLTSAN